MPALTQAYETFERPGLVVAYRMSNIRIFKGALVGLNASGHLVPMAHGTANLRFVGVANETVDNSTGAAGGRTLSVSKSGSFVYRPLAAMTVANLGQEVFANTDNEVQTATAGLTNQYKVGTIVALESTSSGGSGVRVRVDNYTV
ncbi:MAG TPA: hypothetical protein PLO61_03775 [Fimbriimonadaceae bacterium]|nr:hypothetical protein [Fimbriimonadaceae bacterium]